MVTDYDNLVTSLQNLLVDNDNGVPSTDFTQILPSMIAYAENKIYAKLNFLNTRTQNFSVTCTPGSRSITIPSTIIGIVEGVSVITPIGNTPSQGLRNPLERVTIDYIDMVWPMESTTGLPTYFTMLSDTVAVLAPTPASLYVTEFTGIFRPTPLSSTNTSTYITANYPALMQAACMIFGGSWQKDFGGNFNPQTESVWGQLYNDLEQVAMLEEERRKSQGRDWTTFTPAPMANPAPPPMPQGR
jgi:hypothetical protein